MLSVGLTGGIGSGKSAVSGVLAELGCAVVDADLVAREVVAVGTPGLAALAEEFGRDILLPDGALDRPALGRQVFGDDAARGRLNAIVHPLVGERTLQLMTQAQQAGARVLVHDVPLLVENGLAAGYHLVAVVDAPVSVRLERLHGRGMTAAEAHARMAAQADDGQRRAVADEWLTNAGSRQQLDDRVRALHGSRLLPYSDNLAARRRAPRGPVRLVDADPTWPAAGARLVARLQRLCPSAVRVEHIGSTAVPGLAAKDVVDLQVEVLSLQDVEALREPLTAGGFPRHDGIIADPVRTELDPDPTAWRKRLHGSADPGRAANVHVRVAGSTSALAAVGLRDLLRADPVARAAYEQDKRRLARLHPEDLEAYAEGKTAVLLPLLRRALDR